MAGLAGSAAPLAHMEGERASRERDSGRHETAGRRQSNWKGTRLSPLRPLVDRSVSGCNNCFSGTKSTVNWGPVVADDLRSCQTDVRAGVSYRDL